MHLIARLLILLLALLAGATPMQAADAPDIFEAARSADLPAITAYRTAGNTLDVYNGAQHTPFMLATYYGHQNAAALLLELGADPCALDDKGSNALMGVAFKGHAAMAQWMLEHTGCDVNHRNLAGQTALMMAALFGQDGVVEHLLAHGADPSLADHQGNTATSLAQGQGLTHILNLLSFTTQ